MAKLDFGSPAVQARRFLPLKPSKRILTSSSRWSIPLRGLTLLFPAGSVELVSPRRSRGIVIPQQTLSKILATTPGRSNRCGYSLPQRVFFFRCRSRNAGTYPKIPAQSIVQTIGARCATKRPKGGMSALGATHPKKDRVTSKCCP